jgi:hypothetical protein
MQLNTGQWAAIGVAAALIFGYILGYFLNRERAEKIFTWLRQGLSTYGEVSIGDKLPGMASGGRLEVNRAAPPLKRVEAVYLLAPRDNPLFLVFHLLQRRGDELVVWLTYQVKPQQSIEVARQGDRQFASRLKDKQKPALTAMDSIHGLQMAAEDSPDAQAAERVRAFINQYTSNVIRLAIRPEKPHLFIRMNLRLMQTNNAVEFFSTLSKIAD